MKDYMVSSFLAALYVFLTGAFVARDHAAWSATYAAMAVAFAWLAVVEYRDRKR